MGFFRKLWARLMKWLKKYDDDFDDLIELVEPVLDALGNALSVGARRIFLEAVKNAVKSAEATRGSSVDKFKAAKDSVLSTVSKEGIFLKDNLINLTIEMMVTALKNGKI